MNSGVMAYLTDLLEAVFALVLPDAARAAGKRSSADWIGLPARAHYGHDCGYRIDPGDQAICRR